MHEIPTTPLVLYLRFKTGTWTSSPSPPRKTTFRIPTAPSRQSKVPCRQWLASWPLPAVFLGGKMGFKYVATTTTATKTTTTTTTTTSTTSATYEKSPTSLHSTPHPPQKKQTNGSFPSLITVTEPSTSKKNCVPTS